MNSVRQVSRRVENLAKEYPESLGIPTTYFYFPHKDDGSGKSPGVYLDQLSDRRTVTVVYMAGTEPPASAEAERELAGAVTS